MYTITAERTDGKRLTLTQYHSAYQVTYAGFGPVAAQVATTSLGMSDGDKINSARRGKRNAVLYVHINGNEEQNRIRLYGFFTPGSHVRLYYKNASRDVYTEGTVESFECDQFESPMVAQISIVCPQPFWMGAEEIVANVNAVVNMFSFPFSIAEEGVELSTVAGGKYATLRNDGDEPTGLIAEVYAQANVTGPVIYNAITNEAIRIKGTLEKGSTLTINTNTGSKGIKIIDANGVTSNALHRKQAGSVWLKLIPGENYLSYAAEEGADGMLVAFRHNELFVGV